MKVYLPAAPQFVHSATLPTMPANQPWLRGGDGSTVRSLGSHADDDNQWIYFKLLAYKVCSGALMRYFRA
jgi:hypothetical protein